MTLLTKKSGAALAGSGVSLSCAIFGTSVAAAATTPAVAAPAKSVLRDTWVLDWLMAWLLGCLLVPRGEYC